MKSSISLFLLLLLLSGCQSGEAPTGDPKRHAVPLYRASIFPNTAVGATNDPIDCTISSGFGVINRIGNANEIQPINKPIPTPTIPFQAHDPLSATLDAVTLDAIDGELISKEGGVEQDRIDMAAAIHELVPAKNGSHLYAALATDKGLVIADFNLSTHVFASNPVIFDYFGKIERVAWNKEKPHVRKLTADGVLISLSAPIDGDSDGSEWQIYFIDNGGVQYRSELSTLRDGGCIEKIAASGGVVE